MINIEIVSEFFETEFALDKHGLDELFALFKLETVGKNQIILKGDSIERNLRFLNKGVIREYYVSVGKEININFYTKPCFITDFVAFINNSRTKKNQESLSEIEVLTIDKQKFLELLNKYQCGKALIDASFQKLLKKKEALEFARITKSPDELYKDLLTHRPDWLQLIPLYHLASYLNVTPETLSRIRKRIS